MTNRLRQAQDEANAKLTVDEQTERVAQKAKNNAKELHSGLVTRCIELNKAENDTRQIAVEVASDMYEFIRNDYHKALNMTIAQLAKDFIMSSDATVRAYAKLGMVNACCETLNLDEVMHLEAGKKLASGLKNDEGKNIQGYKLADHPTLVQRIRFYHELKAEHGEGLKTAQMAVNMVKGGVESVEDAEALAEKSGESLAEAVNPNKKSATEQAETARQNLVRYIKKMMKENEDNAKDFIAETKKMLTLTNLRKEGE